MGVLKIILPVIVMLAIGVLCRKKQLISEAGIDGFQALVMNFALPAVLFLNFYNNSISADMVLLPVVLFVVTLAGIFVGKLVCCLFRQRDPAMPLMMAGYEAGQLGYTLLALLVGSSMLSRFAVMDIGHTLAIFTVYIAMVKGIGGEKQTAGETIKGILTTPVLIAVFAGLIVSLSGLGAFLTSSGAVEVVDAVFDFISAPTSALILVVIGYRMAFSLDSVKAVLKASVIRILIQAVFFAVIYLVFKQLGGIFSEEITLISLAVMFILPPPYVLPIYLKDKEKKTFYSTALSFYTILSMVAFFLLSILVAG